MQSEEETYIFNIDAFEWRTAEDGDVFMDLYSPTVQMGLETFFLVGGYDGDDYETGAIHRLVCPLARDEYFSSNRAVDCFRYEPATESWTQLNTTLLLERRSGAAIAVPDDVANCF